MAQKRDYYEVLGVSKGASDDEIKKAYRRLAKENHPDLHPGDAACEERFKEVNEAYSVLSDTQKRQQYDQFGFDGPQGAGGFGGGAGGFGGGFGGFDMGDIFDSFFGGDIFGGGRRANGPVAGNDLEYDLRITFEEAAFGCQREIQILREENCEACQGSGAKNGTAKETCPDCQGTGQVRRVQNTPLGRMQSVGTCPKCRGTGTIIKEPCPSCGGRGRMRKTRTINFKVPAGIDNGQRISLRGEGEAGLRGGPAGDLYIRVHVQPHKLFRRQGFNILCEVPIPVTTAILGGDIEVPTLEGKTTYHIPEGTQPGTNFTLRNQGIQQLGGRGRGDLILTCKVEIPRKLSDKQREALKSFEAALTGREYKESKSFFEKMKDLLG